MKYLFIVLVLLGCENKPRKVTKVPPKHDVQAGISAIQARSVSDTVALNTAMDRIFRLPEVQAIDKQINKNSGGKHGVSIIAANEFGNDSSYYSFMVGDNSHDDRYQNIFNFVVEKKTGQVMAYDPMSDSIINLEDWRKARQ